jgi:phosphate/phosphite/phosphonate ABC transporter binding protein
MIKPTNKRKAAKPKNIFKLLCVFYFLSLFFLLSCSSQKDNSFNKPEISQLNYDKTASPITILILPTQSPSDMYEKFLSLKYYLEKAINRPINIKVSKDYESAISEIGNGNVHLAFLDPLIYCEARFKYKNKITPLVKPIGTMGNTAKSVFVVRDYAPIDKVADLKNKRLALGSIRSSVSYLIPLSILNDVSLKMDDFMSVDFLEQEDRVALSVLVGYHDAGALSENIAKKYIDDGLKVIKTSEAIPTFVLCSSDTLSENLRKEITNALISLNDRTILSSIDPKMERFIIAEDRDFDVIRVMIKNLTGRDYIEYGEKTIKVAVLPLYSAITLYDRYEPLMKYLSKKTGMEFKLIIPKDFEDFVDIVKNRKVDFSYQNPYVFALINREIDITPLVTTIGEDQDIEIKDREDRFRGIIITRHDSPIKNINDLKGKKVLITSFKSAGGYLSQKIFLQKLGIDVEKDMKLIDAKKQENVILGVYRGEADAGFVRESALVVWKDVVDIKKIKVLARTSLLPNWPFAAVKSSGSSLAKDVKNLLIELKDSAVLNAAKIKGFKETNKSEFEELKQY